MGRLARWIDFENDYRTMYPSFMETIWWVFKQLYNKGLVYQGYKVMPYATACNTPLSNFKSGQNYIDVVVSFPLEDEPDVSYLLGPQHLGHCPVSWPSWFVRVVHTGEHLLPSTKDTYWAPDFVKEK